MDEPQLKFFFGDGILTAKNLLTGETTRGRMETLRRLYDEGGELPPVFRHKRALELLGRWHPDRKAKEWHRKASHGY